MSFSHISGGEKLPVVFDSVGKDPFLRSLDCLRPRGLTVTFGQASGPIDPIAPVLLSQKGSLEARATSGSTVLTI
jgi:NADPH2:quinone reductase